MKIVINAGFGGFSLSSEAIRAYALRKGLALTDIHASNPLRDDPDLVAVVQELGKAANGCCASLKVVTIPDGVNWEICEYDGLEHVAECHRTWR